MEDRSSSMSLFRQSAEDLATRLGLVQTAEAASMAREASELARLFTAWEAARPDQATRIARIQQLFELNRRAMDFLSKQGRPSSASAPPSSQQLPRGNHTKMRG